MYKICIDPGHGGRDSGAVALGLVEEDINLVASFACRDYLLAHGGYDVLMTRESDKYLSLQERANIANNWGADAFVSNHINAGGGDGAETIHSIYGTAGKDLAESIAKNINVTMGQNIRRVFSRKSDATGKDYYGVIRMTKMAAVIVEGAFIDNEVDNDIIDTVEEQKIYGIAVAKGIIEHFEGSVTETRKPDPVVEPTQESISTWEYYVTGEIAMALQSALNNAGLRDKYGNRLKEDGYLGDRSVEAMEKVFIKAYAKNSLVRVVQRRLIAVGFPLPKYGADSTMSVNGETDKAVGAFQSSRGLNPDRIVGKKTIKELFKK